MPRFAANLTMMFNEYSFLDRFDAAADAGFSAVEYLFPYEHSPDDIALRLTRNHLTQALFNLPAGDWSSGERGLACLSGRFDELNAGTVTALTYAKAMGVKRLHLMAGIGEHTPDSINAYTRAVSTTAETLAKKGIDLLLEPINRRDMPGYFLSDFLFAEQLIERLALPNLKLQFDIYHRQIIHGDVTFALRKLLPMIGHIQIASVPSRHEPDREEINYAFLFDELDRLGYDGFVGCEYRPRAGTKEGLGWFAPYRDKSRGRA